MSKQQPYAKLRGKIKEVFGTQESFAQAMSLNTASLSSKLNDKTQWKKEEIALACKQLDIPLEDVSVYFFS